MKPTFFVFTLLLIVFSTSCSSTRKAGKGSKKNLDSTYLLQQMTNNKFDADWFSARLRVTYEGEDQSVSGSATLRMKKDSAVWMSVKKLGLELARVLVTKDSVYVLDRFNREYSVESLDYLASSYGLPASLLGLQDFLLGNAVIFDDQQLGVKPLGPTYQLTASSEALISDYWIDASEYFVHKMAFNDKSNNQQVNVLLEEFAPTTDQQKFSYLRSLDINSPSLSKVTIGIKFSKLEVNIPKELNFEIPSKYTRAN
jgi:hypothetical protein